jgi:SAM-dependent methyltransferase
LGRLIALKREEIFRDTTNWYLNQENAVTIELIDFAAQNAGPTILDIGCATGDYCIALTERGFKCTGADINPQYVEKARDKNVNAFLSKKDHLDFPDNSFDTALLFEVLEHVDNPQNLLKEAKRVAKKNVLITVPNCSQLSQLSKFNLTYEHILEDDHVNFFTKNDLKDLLSGVFNKYNIIEGDLMSFGAAGLPSPLRTLILGLYKIKLVKFDISYRLYALAEV